MKDNLFEIDTAMNMIKEEMIKELSELVSKQCTKPYIQDISPNSLSFSEKMLD